MSMIGKKALYVMPGFAKGRMFLLASTLNNIGRNQDVQVPNETEVTILSEPTKVISPIHGELEVINVFAGDQSFWARTDTIFEIQEMKVWN